MSRPSEGTSLLDKLEKWLNVRTSIAAMFGALAFSFVANVYNALQNPSQIILVFTLPINEFLWLGVQNAVMALLPFVLYLIWRPAEQGLQENQAKLFHMNLESQIQHVEEALAKECIMDTCPYVKELEELKNNPLIKLIIEKKDDDNHTTKILSEVDHSTDP